MRGFAILGLCGILCAPISARAEFPSEGDSFLGYCAAQSSFRPYCLGWIHGVMGAYLSTNYAPYFKCIPPDISDEQGLNVVLFHTRNDPKRATKGPLTLVIEGLLDAYPCGAR